MTLTITGTVTVDAKTRKYAEKVIASLEKYVPRGDRAAAQADVVLDRVDRAHGNKYEAAVTVRAGGKTYAAADSTLNVLAALDIVRVKLALALKKDLA